MSYSSRDRDRGRRAVVAATGVGAVGALTATGWLMGAAASDLAAQQAASTDATPTAAAPTAAAPTDAAPTGRRERPYVTRVTLRYVTAAGTASSVPGSGGTLTRVSSGGSGSSGPSGSSSGPGPAPATGPAPEPAPPAPSSGS